MITYKVIVDDYGDIRWYNEKGQLHREDGPAYVYAHGTKYWYQNGQIHREDGPAIEWTDGDKEWFLNNKLHREDGPAIECPNGRKFWYLNGNRISEEDHALAMSPIKELSVAEIEKILGYRVKIIKE